MELKFWIYIIVGAIYLLTKFIKKQEPASPPVLSEDEEPHPRMEIPTTHTNKPKPLTFEELLREITESKTPVSQPKPVPTTYVDYDDNLGEEAQDLEEIPASYKKKDTIYKMYEEGKQQAFFRPSLEETMKIQDTDVSFVKFKGFEAEEEPDLLAGYMRDLSDPEGFKKAFVMSEILNRRF